MIPVWRGKVVHAGEIGLHKTAYLTLDKLAADPELSGRLPPDLAWRCHALPLAEDDGRVTVAMADPGGAEPREVVVAATPAPDSLDAKKWRMDSRHRVTFVWTLGHISPV